ncbi:MAG: PTS sugar transporter subunit IIC, partial [Syntrophales bacterium]|nr:PTS sugar transporter subunit IIC [Syntrophales bacterium]
MLSETLVVATVGGTLCLDRVAIQLMVSRPIVVAPLTGLILGDAPTGLFIGAVMEMLWCDRPPLGNYVPPNDSLTAVVMTAAVILAAPAHT